MPNANRERLLYIDNLRLLMIIFVVMVHLGVTYSGIGGWYYKEGATLDTVSTIFFGFFQSFTQGYFMGLMFLIAGYFVPAAYDKNGFAKFVRNRFIRLGIPALMYMLLIHPLIIYFLLGINWPSSEATFIKYYFHYILSFKFVGESGPLWFALALLIFSVIYALIRLTINKNNSSLEHEALTTKKYNISNIIDFLISLYNKISTTY